MRNEWEQGTLRRYPVVAIVALSSLRDCLKPASSQEKRLLSKLSSLL
ncbi:hypothetical protein [Amycolatopsis thailandensis]|nr:hypothetical protein [Amycolatopsis thailandensis]